MLIHSRYMYFETFHILNDVRRQSINPQHACATKVAVVGLCVCLSAHGYSATIGLGAAIPAALE